MATIAPDEPTSLLENATEIINVWHTKHFRKAIVSFGVVVACGAIWCARMEFNVTDLRSKHEETTKAIVGTNAKVDKLDTKMDHGFEVLGTKIDKLSDDTHTLMGQEDAIRRLNP